MASDNTYESYYVPHNSPLPIFASLGLFLTVYGGGSLLNEMSSGASSNFGITVFMMGGLVMAATLFFWFSKVIEENHAKMYSQQMNKSFVWGMSWFIFSEVMFFATVFATLFYTRIFIIPWLSGTYEGQEITHYVLWPHFQMQWPLFNTPDPSMFLGPLKTIPTWEIPALNTLILLTSGLTITVAHWGIIRQDKKMALVGQGLTILLGVIFLFLQAHEYVEAYHIYDLKLNSGVYGNTFFMLTGLHGFHVALGTVMLICIWFRIYFNHFNAQYHFAFEAVAWYWHFVDVVWLILFVFVYWI